MDTVALYQRPATDIAIRPGDTPMVRPRSVRHLLADTRSDIAIDGYVKQMVDIVDWPRGSYFDPEAQDCSRCAEIAAQAGVQPSS